VNDPAGIKLPYRKFADMECRGYSEAYYRLALAVAEDDDVVGFLSQMPVAQPNLFFASVHFLAGRDPMPSTGPELRQFLRRRGGEVGDVMRSRRTQTNFCWGARGSRTGSDTTSSSAWPTRMRRN
jgi:hypothetical protein